MSKSHLSISPAQLEHRQAAQAKRQRLDWIWAIITLAILVGFIVVFTAIQISHHV
jgi:uncharacterized membrane protein (DUF485 family)